jgi:hypothetical protein
MKEARIIQEEIYTLRKGINNQRELYKRCRYFYDIEGMVSCIENIKSEIAYKCKNNEASNEDLAYIEKVLEWYRNLFIRFKKKTPNGVALMFPSNYRDITTRNLQKAYERLMHILERLELL